MSSQADELVRFLRVMDEAGCLEHVVLIGSWAEYVWWHADLMEGFRPNIRTLDIDLLVRNMRRPVPPRSRPPRDRAGIVHKEGAVACRRVHGAARAGRIGVGAALPRCMPHDAEPCTVKQAACTHGPPKCQEGSSPF